MSSKYGYCAWVMTEQRLAVTDPEVSTIMAGKVYLNCSREACGKWSGAFPATSRRPTIWKEKFGGK